LNGKSSIEKGLERARRWEVSVVIELGAAKGLKAEIGGVGIWLAIPIAIRATNWSAAYNAAGISPTGLVISIIFPHFWR
jgi:hypothetical protein